MVRDPQVVRVETAAGKPFGDVMNSIRSWLDSQKIQVADFKVIPDRAGFGFEIGFRTDEDAERFRRRFGVVR